MKQIRNILLPMGILFAALGIFFMIFGAWQYSVCDRLMTQGVSAQGVCQWRSGDELWIEFEAEGKVWQVKSSVRSDSLRSDEKVTVWYMSGDPAGARLTEWWTYGIFLIMGSLFTVIGLAFTLWQMHIILHKRSLEVNGQKVWADVTEVKLVRAVRIGGRHPYVIHAVCTHPYTGSQITVKSRLIANDPHPYLAGGKVEVLVDMMNERRYHVLTDALEGGGAGVAIENDL